MHLCDMSNKYWQKSAEKQMQSEVWLSECSRQQ